MKLFDDRLALDSIKTFFLFFLNLFVWCGGCPFDLVFRLASLAFWWLLCQSGFCDYSRACGLRCQRLTVMRMVPLMLLMMRISMLPMIKQLGWMSLWMMLLNIKTSITIITIITIIIIIINNLAQTKARHAARDTEQHPAKVKRPTLQTRMSTQKSQHPYSIGGVEG